MVTGLLDGDGAASRDKKESSLLWFESGESAEAEEEGFLLWLFRSAWLWLWLGLLLLLAGLLLPTEMSSPSGLAGSHEEAVRLTSAPETRETAAPEGENEA